MRSLVILLAVGIWLGGSSEAFGFDSGSMDISIGNGVQVAAFQSFGTGEISSMASSEAHQTLMCDNFEYLRGLCEKVRDHLDHSANQR